MRAPTIRQERPEEFDAIYDLVKDAFATARVSDGTEQDFVNRLRAGGAYIPELALVAEEEGELAGHIMLTAIVLTLDPEDGEREGRDMAALLLAPLCVRLESRSRGLGAALTEEAFKRARKLGRQAVFLVGDPAYYGRFGFRPAVDFGIRHRPESLPAQYTLACELVPGALAGRRGVVDII